MNIQEIEISKIAVPSFYYKLEDSIIIEKLVNSVDTYELLRPIVVKQTKSGYECIEGRKILEVSKRLGKDKIMCVVHAIDIDSEAINLVLNILEPPRSLAKIAFFMKGRTESVGEKKLSSFFPYSVDEIKRFCEITTFDWSKFQKQQSKGQLTLGDAFNIDERKIEIEEVKVEVKEDVVIEVNGEKEVVDIKFDKEKKEIIIENKENEQIETIPEVIVIESQEEDSISEQEQEEEKVESEDSILMTEDDKFRDQEWEKRKNDHVFPGNKLPDNFSIEEEKDQPITVPKVKGLFD